MQEGLTGIAVVSDGILSVSYYTHCFEFSAVTIGIKMCKCFTATSDFNLQCSKT